MATEEIQISQLELAQEVQGDMVFAVDTATDTKSLSVNQLKNHISQPLQANINAVDTSALHKYNITNCITEIPQDIKLELNNGTLTLKAGSKVYIPNGFESDGTTPKFDEVTLENDISRSNFSIDGTFVLWVGKNSLAFGWRPPSETGSGDSTSSFSGLYYRTDLNKILYENDTSREPGSFPICIFTTANSGVPVSIDQVFNGFGYIGSTIFALPGVKGLIPNGRNADGTLKNIEFTTNEVVTRTFTDAGNGIVNLLTSNSISTAYEKNITYNNEENILYNRSSKINEIPFVYVDRTSATNTRWNPKTAFHAVDYNDFEKAMLKEDWVKVSTVPASPDSSKFYYIPEN